MNFAELNLVYRGNPEKMLNLVKRAVRMGYDCVVINIDIGDFSKKPLNADNDETPKPKKKRKSMTKQEQSIIESDFVPDPFLIDPTKLDLTALKQASTTFRQFSRLTATLNDSTSVHKFMHHPKLKLFDIIAVRFEDEQILTTLTRKGELIDLISIDASAGKISWLFKQKLVQACIAAGLSFELAFSNALISTENRRQFFTNARMLMEITRGGRGVVISSGAEDIISIRAPFDVANLCTLFGLDPRHGRKFIGANASAVILRAQSRRTIKGAIHVTSDLSKIPTTNDKTPDEALKELTSIPEFQKQLI